MYLTPTWGCTESNVLRHVWDEALIYTLSQATVFFLYFCTQLAFSPMCLCSNYDVHGLALGHRQHFRKVLLGAFFVRLLWYFCLVPGFLFISVIQSLSPAKYSRYIIMWTALILPSRHTGTHTLSVRRERGLFCSSLISVGRINRLSSRSGPSLFVQDNLRQPKRRGRGLTAK